MELCTKYRVHRANATHRNYVMMHSCKCIHLQKDDAEIYRETFFRRNSYGLNIKTQDLHFLFYKNSGTLLKKKTANAG